jgi:hypothetical protein
MMPTLRTLTWPTCHRCEEPIDPANVVTRRPWPPEAGGAGVRRYHPGGWAGCVAAAKNYHRAELDAAIVRIGQRMTADPCPRCGGDHDRIDRREPCEPRPLPARCTHRGDECIRRREALDLEQLQADGAQGAPDPWASVRALPPTIAWHDEGR